jgi:hypothetical protein
MGMDDNTPTLKFHYIKSNYWRVIRAEGAIGGITPSGDIFFSLYNERVPLPDVTVQAIENGHLSPEIIEQRKTSDGILRDIEVGVNLSAHTAKALIKWLQEKVEILEQFHESVHGKVPSIEREVNR